MGNLSDYFGRNIDRRKIVITGGSTGIGKAAALLLSSLVEMFLSSEGIRTT